MIQNEQHAIKVASPVFPITRKTNKHFTIAVRWGLSSTTFLSPTKELKDKL